MATTKKTARPARKSATRTATKPARPADPMAQASSRAQQQAEDLARTLTGSAHDVWLAGIGALGRAHSEGGKLFDALVREGRVLEDTARRSAEANATAVRQAVETQVDDARRQAGDAWDRFEQGLQVRVQQALSGLGVASRNEVDALRSQVQTLNAQLHKARNATARPTPAKKAAKRATSRRSDAS